MALGSAIEEYTEGSECLFCNGRSASRRPEEDNKILQNTTPITQIPFIALQQHYKPYCNKPQSDEQHFLSVRSLPTNEYASPLLLFYTQTTASRLRTSMLSNITDFHYISREGLVTPRRGIKVFWAPFLAQGVATTLAVHGNGYSALWRVGNTLGEGEEEEITGVE